MDICDANPVFELTDISSNEPDEGLGDGDQPNDIQGADYGTPDTEFLLRAERSGLGDGRIYTITYTGRDASDNTATAVATVTVAHDREGRAIASNGFNSSGTDFELNQQSFVVVIPTIPASSGTPPDDVISATSVVIEEAYVGNTCDAIRPDLGWMSDFDEDGFDDLALVYSVAAATDVALRSDEMDGPLGLHFTTQDGTAYLVPDIFALGSPLIVNAPVTAVDDPSTDSQQMDLPTATSVTVYPNPFNPSTTVDFSLAADQHVDVKIYDARGALICGLANSHYAAGRHKLSWDGRDSGGRRVGSGVYFLRFVYGEHKTIHKLIILK
jgi:hypothetical protein